MMKYSLSKNLLSVMVAVCMVAVLLINIPPVIAAVGADSVHDKRIEKGHEREIISNHLVGNNFHPDALGPDGSNYIVEIKDNGAPLEWHITIDIIDNLNLTGHGIILIDGTSTTAGNKIYLTINGNGNKIYRTNDNLNKGLMEIKGGSNTANIHTTINNLTFEGGDASAADGYGGALYYKDNDGDLTLNNCSFISNKADEEGGAVYIDNSSSTQTAKLVINNCLFQGNQSAKGGAVFANDGIDVDVSGSEFYDNSATDSSSGGAIHIADANNSLQVNGPCYFSGNTPEGNVPTGDAVYGFYLPNTGWNPDFPTYLIDGRKPAKGVAAVEAVPLKLPAKFTVKRVSPSGYTPIYLLPDSGSPVVFRLGYYYTVTAIRVENGYLLCEYKTPDGKVYTGYVDPAYLGRSSDLTW